LLYSIRHISGPTVTAARAVTVPISECLERTSSQARHRNRDGRRAQHYPHRVAGIQKSATTADRQNKPRNRMTCFGPTPYSTSGKGSPHARASLAPERGHRIDAYGSAGGEEAREEGYREKHSRGHDKYPSRHWRHAIKQGLEKTGQLHRGGYA